MSRNIDLDQPLSADDIQYLRERNRLAELNANFEEFGNPEEVPEKSETPETPPTDPAEMTDEQITAWAKSLTKDQIIVELKKTGAKDEDLPKPSDSKDKHVAALLAAYPAE